MKVKSVVLYFIYHYLFWLPDRWYLSLLYRVRMNKRLNLRTPRTFNEKLNWLKLYDRKPQYTQLVDKYTVKQFITNTIGSQYVIPTIGLWNSPDEIDFASLPSSFVLKTTHGGGNTGVVICKDKSTADFVEIKSKLKQSYKDSIYRRLREWPYKNVKPRIIAEPFMVDSMNDELIDYKFFAFDGCVQALFVATGRNSGEVKFDFFDKDFQPLDIVQSHPQSGINIKRPSTFDEMIYIAEKLSVGIPHVRVDLYEINGRVYFGELTFYHHGAVTPFHPEEWDYKFGSWLTLPKII